MSRILFARKSKLVSENIFEDENHANKVISIMENIINEKNNNRL